MMWKIEIGGDLGQGLPTPKNWEEGEAEKVEEHPWDTIHGSHDIIIYILRIK